MNHHQILSFTERVCGRPAMSCRSLLLALVLAGGVHVQAQLPPQSSIAASWPGMAQTSSIRPPDPHGSAGPNGIIQVVNVRIEYWTKTGTRIWGPTGFSSFFPWATGAFQSDPRALYDPQSGRFIVEILDLDFNNNHSYIDLAISKNSDPQSPNATDWNFYRIENTRTVGGKDYWGDYSAMGFDSQAIYVTLNLYGFTSGAGDAQITVIDKAAALAGNTNYAFVYVPGGQNGGFTLQPCTVIGTTGPKNVAYFGETMPANSSTRVRIWALSDPLGARTLTSTLVNVPDNGNSPNGEAPQPSTARTVDPSDGRTQGNAFWINGSIWFCTTAGGSTGRSLVYYYKVDIGNFPTNGTPTLGESGKIDGGPGMWTYQASIGGNRFGDVCLVYTESSTATNPTILFTVHPAGTTNFETPTVLKASPTFSNSDRWGDYASVSADPTDDTFWVTHEYSRSSSAHDWGTWWGNIKVGNPATVVQQPVGLSTFEGDNVTLTVSAAGTLPINYQWRFNGNALAGATTSALSLANITAAQGGLYSAIVSNSFGGTSSSNALVVVTPVVPLPVALNASNLVWTTSGNANWHGLTNVTHDGSAAGQSGPIADGQSTLLKTTVTGPGTLSFWWKVSSQTNADFLNFSVGGALQAAISGDVDWEQRIIYLTSGTQNLQWNYTKDTTAAAGLDAGWVDQVAYSFGSSAALILSQPASQTVVAGAPVMFTVGAGGTPALHFQWLFNGANIVGATGSSYSLAQAWFTNSGAYSVAVSNDFGFIVSSNAFLSVSPIATWGNNDFDQSTPLAGLSNVIAIAAGGYHNLALRADGRVLAWGDDFDGQTDVPLDLTNAVSIAGGGYHSLAVRADGTVAAWGASYDGQTSVPSEASSVVSVAAGSWHSLALRADGTVLAWGDNSFGQCDVPVSATNIVAIAAGAQHSLALRSDTTVLAWGSDVGPDGGTGGQIDVPWDLTGAVAIAGGDFHSMALKDDGTVVAWGDNSAGQTSIPASLTRAVGIAAGGIHSLAVQEGGTAIAWGDNLYNQSVVGNLAASVSEVAAGSYHSLALLGRSITRPQLLNPSRVGNTFRVSVVTHSGKAYFLQYKDSLLDTQWTTSSAVAGNGGLRTITDSSLGVPFRVYRVLEE